VQNNNIFKKKNGRNRTGIRGCYESYMNIFGIEKCREYIYLKRVSKLEQIRESGNWTGSHKIIPTFFHEL